jgi:flavin-dependent dehydrogenase
VIALPDAPTAEHDVLIIGGGPAGSTTGALLKKYHPHLRVGLIEQSEFPRYHIGESLIIEANRILKDLGALDTVAGAGFLRKGGATFVWGEDREPWSLLFADARRLRPDPTSLFDHTWHVLRERYDTLLLGIARDLGVEVMQPLAVEDPVIEEGRVCGVRTARGVLRARTVVDASGRAGVVARHIGRRIYDPLIRNVGVFGYWRGAKLEPRYSGNWDLSRIVVLSIPIGWIWYIPISKEYLSVGVVTSAEQLRNRDGSIDAFYRRELASSPEVSAWLSGASLESDVRVESDFNYCHERLAGPGYLLVGDAAGFVDPLFSIGVFLAQSAAQLAAYALGSAAGGALDEARLCSAYEHHLRGQYQAFRAMAYVFYGFNSSKEEWWRRTRELMRSQALPDDITDREAFEALTFGFGVNLTLFREAISCFGQLAGPQLRDILMSGKQAPEPELRDYQRVPRRSAAARPKLVKRFSVAPSFIPVEGTGRVIPMSRVEIEDAAPGREARFPRSLYVPDELAALLGRLDGQTPLAALGDGPHVEHVIRALDGMGALK